MSKINQKSVTYYLNGPIVNIPYDGLSPETGLVIVSYVAIHLYASKLNKEKKDFTLLLISFRTIENCFETLFMILTCSLVDLTLRQRKEYCKNSVLLLCKVYFNKYLQKVLFRVHKYVRRIIGQNEL